MIGPAVRRADNIGYVWGQHFNGVVNTAGTPKINLIIPALDTAIIFGGYISYFQFARFCWREGADIRFIVTERFEATLKSIISHCETWFPEIAALLSMAEIVDCTNGARPEISFSPSDLIVAYSCSTALIAHNTIRRLALSPFIFYIQEEEGHFHAHNSFRALMEAVYDLPHTAIFNSPLLENFYRQNRLGVFAEGLNTQRSVSFKHALTVKRIPSQLEMSLRRPKRLLFFARPEPHAERNLFELGLVALRHATYANLFPAGDWELHAIGTECFPPQPLYNGQDLKFIGRFPLDVYGRMLADYDVGLSLMYAPHPSVPNFEMAASGLVTVTTEFSNRRKVEMETICPNFIAARPTIDSLVDALSQAVARSGQWEQRRRNAVFAWPRSWAESFDADFSSRFRALLGENYPEVQAKVFVDARRKERMRLDAPQTTPRDGAATTPAARAEQKTARRQAAI